MKRFFSGILACLLILSLLPVMPMTALAANEDNYYYSVTDNEATITGYNLNASGAIEIPATLGGYPVVAIGDQAFQDCRGLTSVTIPEGVTTIGFEAFGRCKGLTSVRIPGSVTTIGDNAFFACNRLKSIQVDTDNPEYSSDASGVLYNKMQTLLIRVPHAISGSYAIPESVTTIGESAFEYCTSLTSVTIPGSVTTIGNCAFYCCTRLTSVTIPESVTEIGHSAFYSCRSFTSVTIPESVTIIGNYAFDSCTGLTSVTIPESVTTIGTCVFYNCTGLTSVTVPESVTTIGYSAFKDCTGLTSVTIPGSVTAIDRDAFYNCSSLTDVWYTGNVTQKKNMSISDSTIQRATWHYSLCESNGHTYNDTICIVCGDSHVHSYDNACDTSCNICGLTRETEHVFDNACDTVCNICGFVRETEHVYDDICDDTCNICGAIRTPPHLYANNCDTTCDRCGHVRTITHIFDGNGQNCTVCRAPVPPTLEKQTDTTVALVAFAGYQYSKDGQNWQDSPVFAGLSPNTPYCFYQRLVDNSTYYISPSSDPLTVTTNKSKQEAPAAPSLESKTDIDVLLTYISGYEYSMDGITWQNSRKFTGLEPGTAYKFYQRKAETNSSFASAASSPLQVTTVARTGKVVFVRDQSSNDSYMKYKLEGIPLTLGTASRTGYQFYGWSTKPYGTVEYTADYTYEAEEDLTVYAVWRQICTACGGNGKTCATCKGAGTVKLLHTVTDAPELEECTSGSITLVQQEDMEYSMDGSIWQKSPVFTDLIPGTTYQFYQRYAENDYRSPAQSLCEALTVSTKNSKYKPDVPVLFRRSHNQVILVLVEGMEYSLDGESWQTSNIFTGLQPDTEYTFYQRYAADGELYASPSSDGLTVRTDAPLYTPGDVTGDDKINSLDGLLLLRYLNGWNVTVNAPEALDVNGDGKVNSLDGLILLRYLNGWDVTLG